MNKIRLVINNELQKKNKEKFFIKKELQSILNLYAKMVSNGSWKDYSFTSGIREVSFNVWGMLPITIIFTAMQLPLINKYKV